ncbi:MAG: DUF134 domain-containing protein [Bacillota bacterium]
MPRQPKPRSVAFFPYVKHFRPAEVSVEDLEEEVITLEELEAMRLKDLEGLDQDACAEKMGISQSTFQRLLAGARFKVARALVVGRGIRLEGGNYQLADSPLVCLSCGQEWEATEVPAEGVACPKCGRGPVVVRSQCGPMARRGWRHGRGPWWRW